MSVARTCRRFRRDIKHDERYNRPTRRDRSVQEQKNRAKWEAEKLRSQRKKG